MIPSTILPHDPAAEISVLGACLQDLAAAQTVCKLLTPADFFDTTRGEVFGLVKALVARGVPPDLVTTFQAASDRKARERVTGALLQDLVEQTPTAANFACHARIVRELATRRRLHDTCVRTAERAWRNGEDLAEVTADLRRNLDTLGSYEQAEGPDLVSMADVTPEAVSWLWPGRFPRGKLSRIIGDPGQGKSCVTMDMAARVSRGLDWPDGGRPPVVASLFSRQRTGWPIRSARAWTRWARTLPAWWPSGASRFQGKRCLPPFGWPRISPT